jgi:hypothetical protein
MLSHDIQTRRALMEMRHNESPMKLEVEFVVNSVDNVCIFVDGDDDDVNAEAKRTTLV